MTEGPGRSLSERVGEGLATPRLWLRPFGPEHGAVAFEAAMESYERLARWGIWILGERGRASAADYERFGQEKARLLEAGLGASLLIFERASGEMAGAASLSRVDPRGEGAFLGFWLREGREGKGYAREAAGRLIEFARRDLGLRGVSAEVDPGNESSKRVLLSLGFEPAGGKGAPEGLELYRLSERARGDGK